MNSNLLGYSLVWPKATVFEIVITGSNPVTSASFRIGTAIKKTFIVKKQKTILLYYAPLVQLDRIPGYELGGRRFESFTARQT